MNKLTPLSFSGFLAGVILLQSGCTGIQWQKDESGRSQSGIELTPEIFSPVQKSSFFFADSTPPVSDKTISPEKTPQPAKETTRILPDSLNRLKPAEPQKTPDSLRTKPDSLTGNNPSKLPVSKADSALTHPKKTGADSLAIADSLAKAKPKTLLEKLADSLQYTSDSTARMEQFTYKRPTRFVPDASLDLKYGLFLANPNSIKKDIAIDSTLQNVIISEKMGDLVLRGPIAMPYQDYVANRFEQNVQGNWQSLIGTRILQKRTDAIEALFSKITNVDIYVPGGGGALFRTIFGPPRINIRVNGSIDVKAGWATNYNSNASSFGGTGSQNDPVFDQQFQMNVQGTVGDKLQISADWSTQRTFEYENSLRIVYTGYEDEIVQKIEAGNVSMSTPARYVQGSSALFGLKSTMQMGPLTWTFLVSQQKGKTETKSISGGSQESAISIKASAYDYDKHFFISAFYREKYEAVFSNPPIFNVTPNEIYQFEVWKQRNSTTKDPNEVSAVALLKLGENQVGTEYQVPGGIGSFYDEGVIDKLRSGELKGSDANLPIPRSEIVDGVFYKLQQNKDYTIDTYTGVIHFLIPSEASSALAIAYTIKSGESKTLKVGDFAIDGNTTGESKTKLILKMIRPDENPNPNNKYAWDLMLKNIYKLPGGEFEEADLDLDIKYDYNNQTQSFLPGSSINLLEVLNLDRLGAKNTGTKDGKFDFIRDYTVNPSRGDITLPFLRPFDSEKLRAEVAGLDIDEKIKANLLFPQLYDTTYQAAKTQTTKDKYIFSGKVKGNVKDRYNLGFNIVEGSVKVLNNNIPLVPNVDYEVDYQLGSIQIKNQTYLTGGSNLTIQYESNDLFTLASKNFVGSRFDFDLTQKLKLGFTWLRYSEKPLTDKVRIGEEPKLNNIIGMDIKWDTQSRFLTKLVNYLPGISTSQPSNFTISGEVAQIIPGHPTELNTKLDPGGVAYIDDFEGSRKSVTLGTNYTNWSLSSAPDSVGNLAVFDARKPDSSITNYRALLRFYNDLSARVPIQDIWPERSVSSRDNTISTFSLEYFPKKRGPFNYSTQLGSTIYNTNGETWGGIQRALPSYLNDLVSENIEFIEFWVQVSDSKDNPFILSPGNTGYLNIDLGYISEDILADGLFNTELGVSQDPLSSTWGKYPKKSSSYVFSKGDDKGLDGLSNNEEAAFYKDFVASLETQNIPPEEKAKILGDVSGDNYSYPQGSFNYSGINGSEGNSNTEGGSLDRLFPDTEDMNGNITLDPVNDYFSYRVPISLDSLKAGKGFVVSSNELTKWYQVRIPLKDFYRKYGNIKDFSSVKYVRMWLGGFKQDVHFQFASLDLVGSQWLKDSKDSTLSIAVINIEENPDKYDSPPGIVRQKDRTRPDENIQMNEQSLEIKVRELKEGKQSTITKTLAQSLNITNYERLKMFVHGPDVDPVGDETAVNYTDTTNYDAEVFLRFGSDSLNYYEVSLPLHPDKRKTAASNATWDINNNFDIDLAKLTALKQLILPGNSIYIERNPVGYPDGARITLRGKPTLTMIKQFNIGVRNPRNKGTILPLNFSIWVNELRVSGFKEETGWAANTSVGVKLADVANVNFVIEKTTAEFRRVSEDVSTSKSNSTTWSIQSSLAVDKFFGEKPIVNLPVSFSHTEAVSTPKYLSGSDILLDKAAELAGDSGDELINLNKSVTVSNAFSLSQVKKLTPSDISLLQVTLDRLAFDFSYSNSFTRNPTVEWSRSWAWKSGLSYSYQFKPDFFIQPLAAPLSVFKSESFYLNSIFEQATLKDWSETKLFLKPSTFNWNVSLNRSRSQNKNREQIKAGEAARQFTAINSFGLGYQISDNLTLTASGSVNSVLSNLLVNANNEERPESDIMGDLFAKMIRLDFGKDQSYSQNIAFNYKIPFLKTLNLTSQYSAQYGWANPNNTSDPKKYMGNNVQWATSISLGSSFRIGDFFDLKKPQSSSGSVPGAKGAKADTLSMKDKMVRDLTSITAAFLSLDAITIRFSQTNSFATQGVAGNSGMLNFFPFNQDWWPDPFRFKRPGEIPGPGLLFQLGLTQDPGARIDSSANSNVSNKFSQSNTLDWKTGFQPTERVKVDLSWKVQWTLQKEDKLDVMTFKSIRSSTSGSYSRSFISIAGDFESIRKALPTNPATGNYILGNNEITNAFRDGLELFQLSDPISKGIGLGIWNTAGWRDLVPLPNWSVQVSGLEKFPLWTSFVQSMSLSHNYTGDYSTSFVSRPDAGPTGKNDAETGDPIIIPKTEYSTPRISERFGPLVGVSINFKKPFTTRINYNTGRTISLSTVNRQVTTQKTSEITASVSYTQSGSTLLTFWPFNGNTLKNDIDLSITGSYAVDQTLIESLTGKTSPPAQGINRVTFEPRIGYAVSTRVNASAFWRYTQSKPITGSLSAAEISRSEIGLNVHISIQ